MPIGAIPPRSASSSSASSSSCWAGRSPTTRNEAVGGGRNSPIYFMERGYVVRTFVTAHGVTDAIRKAKKMSPDEVYLMEDWMKLGKFLPEESEVKGFRK